MCKDCVKITNGWTGEFTPVVCDCSCENTTSVMDNIKRKEEWVKEYRKKDDWFAEAMTLGIIDSLTDNIKQGIYIECGDCKHFLRRSFGSLTLEQKKEIVRVFEDYDIDLDANNKVPNPLDFNV